MSRNSMLFKSLTLCACALACVAALADAADARQATKKADSRQSASRTKPAPKPPLTKDYVLDSLRKGKPTPKELVRLVKGRGVDFELSGDDESLLREAGATPELLDVVRANYRRPAPHLPVPATIVADPVLMPDSRDVPYIAPVSPAQESKGPGTGTGTGTGPGTGEGTGASKGGGMGTGTGSGTGSGSAPGAGGGTRYPDTYTSAQVTKRAVIISRPPPSYTEEARKNSVTGTVTLRLILAASGEVTNISVVRGLPDGLTVKAIEAARKIKFKPAEKDGRAVSQWALVEYNFNIH